MKVLKQAEKADLIRIAFEERALDECLKTDGDCFWFGEIRYRWVIDSKYAVRSLYRVLDEVDCKKDLSTLMLEYLEVREIGFYKIARWDEVELVIEQQDD